MKLKSLEISGFKSFADDTKIEFEDGVTGIVGPNGSGKSNVSEAIRWVLGEQSAKNLRGSRMPDVIFAGSSDRKPLNRAMVTMILDNSDHYLKSDYTEINVTRKLFRNGESNYQLNGQDCRLKDILNLFMDSGIGDNAFSMISQGRVEAIFNSKPEDRRFIVEELIGVSKYRQGKEKAQRELDQTANYLDRVNDLTAELSGQIEPLAQQSALAQEYVDQKRQFDELDQTRLVIESETLSETLKQKQTALKHKQEQVTEVRTHLTQTQAALSKAKATTTQLRNQKDQTNTELLTVSEQKQQVAGAQALDSERQKHQEQTLTDLKNRVASLKKTLATNQAQSDSTQQSAEKLKQELQKDRHQAQELKQTLDELDATRLAEKQDQLQANYIDQLQTITTLHNQKQYLEKNQQRVTSESKQISARLTTLNQELNEQKQHQKATQQQLLQFESEIAKLKQVCEQLEQTHSKRAEQIDTLNQQWLSALEVAQQAKARLHSLTELAENYTGFYQGTRAIMQAKDKLDGILGPVAELILVPDGYTKAIEAAIGAQQQHVVVTTQAAGKRAIQYLTNNRLGRSTFLPVDTIRANHVTPNIIAQLQSLTGFLGVGSQLVTSTDPAASTVVEHLLGNVLFADNLSHAVEIANRINHRYRVISLSGEVVATSGAMSGGRDKHERTGILTQQQELKKLKQQVSQMDQQLADKQAKLTELKQVQATDDNTDQQSQLAQLTDQHQKLANDLKLIEERMSSLTRQITIQTSQLGLNGDDEDYDIALLKNESDTKQAETDLNDIKAKMEKVKEQQADRESAVQSTSSAYQDQRAVVTTKSVQLKQLTREVDQINQQIASQQQQLNELEERITTIHQTQEQIGTANSSHKESLTQLADRQQQLTQRLTKLITQLARATATEEELSASEQSAMTTLNVEQSAAQQLEFDCSKLATKAEQLQTELSENYHVSLQFAEAHQISKPLAVIKQKIKLLKRGLADLGDVNLASIEDYDRVKTRYDFLTQQQADLNDSKNNLLATMNEMDQEVIERFDVTFKQLNQQFSATFVKMFGGGRAKLELTDPEHLLTTGIEIMAEPPGKRLQSMRLLSGGERALTAITLLFAVLQVQPAPFAVLDEAEAALDPANTGRFASYLNQFEDDTQFIVITHRKETMVQADRLYGITMQESGVSKLVSVDLNQVNQV